MKENGREFNFNPIIEHELGQENVNNIEKFGKTIKTLATEKGIEAHLILVGGNVKPEKRGKDHKDVDLVLYSPQLAPVFFRVIMIPTLILSQILSVKLVKD